MRQGALEGTHLRSVLFPTDFSEISYGALSYAECLTRYISGQLLLLHVYESVAGTVATWSLTERATIRGPGEDDGRYKRLLGNTYFAAGPL